MSNPRRLGYLCALLTVVLLAQPLGAETILHNFVPPPKGYGPNAGVVRDRSGNLYGTTPFGGSAGLGVLYKVNAAGKEIVLHNFTGGADGSRPNGGVTRDSAGNLYGATDFGGGSADWGTVYKIDTSGHETVLYSFQGGADGGFPHSDVIRDSAGNLYGTTEYGGDLSACSGSGCGVVFKVDISGHETVLYTFTGGADGGTPYAGVTRDSAGNLYGTTHFGGIFSGCGGSGCGVVYKVDASGNETVLYSFTGGVDGGQPNASVIRDSAGNLYGTTYFGGSGCGGSGCGAVYKVDRSGNETAIYSFNGGASGDSPVAGVTRDQAGNFYGTTYFGGNLSVCSGNGCGVVYKVDAAGNETVLYQFTGQPDGSNPWGGVIRDSSGNLYGTTRSGGSGNAGTVFKVDRSGHETALSFIGDMDGMQPYAGVIRDKAGNLYGTTQFGGVAGQGTVYKLNIAGHETTVYSFTGGADGGNPTVGVIRDTAGNLYGTTSQGGTANAGTVYKVDKSGHKTVLYSFSAGADGGYPYAGVIRDKAGNLYGTTNSGGSGNSGVVYKVDASGNETALYNFTGGVDGSGPWAGVIRDKAGSLYGTAQYGGAAGAGVVYKVDASGNETVLYNFTGGADGGYPQTGVVRDSAGNLYGTTQYGGNLSDCFGSGCGVVYKVDTSGNETVVYTFTGGADGSYPNGVILDSTGNLYGTTNSGGNFAGVVYKVDPVGNETVLHTFTDGDDGGYPQTGVVRDEAGNLYGATSSGGKKLSGIVFRVP